MKSIGKEIRSIIKKKGISLYQVAKDSGITWESLYRSLLDGANPEWRRIGQILDYLDYDFILKPKRKDVESRKSRPSRERFRKGNLMEQRKTRFGENLNKQIHEHLHELFLSKKGAMLTTGEIEKLYRTEYAQPDVMWMQPPDHCINWTNKGHCWCSETNDAIFERIKRGVYKVR